MDSTLLASNVNATSATAWNSSTVYIAGDVVQRDTTNFHHTFESKTGLSATFTVTIASPAVVTMTGHGQIANTPWVASTTGALPTGIVAGTVYYIVAPTANTFNLSTTPGGAALNTTGTQSGVHTARTSNNFNKDPATAANETYWIDLGSTNRWKMFDQGVQTQTTNAGTINVTIQAPLYVSHVTLLNLAATSVQVKMTDLVDGLIYDETIDLTSYEGVTDWYSWFFLPIRKKTDIVFTGFPNYANTQIQIIVNNPSSTAACGACLIGFAEDISYEADKGTAAGVKLGIQDYSIKERDSFGNYSIVERAFNRRADFSVLIDNSDIDYIMNLLSSRRAIPTLYIGTKKYTSTIVYGFYKDFDIDIAYVDNSFCSIQLEGLT